jgi:hypothetical protein
MPSIKFYRKIGFVSFVICKRLRWRTTLFFGSLPNMRYGYGSIASSGSLKSLHLLLDLESTMLSSIYEGGNDSLIFDRPTPRPGTTRMITSFFTVLLMERGTNANIDSDTISRGSISGRPLGASCPLQGDLFGVVNSDPRTWLSF